MPSIAHDRLVNAVRFGVMNSLRWQGFDKIMCITSEQIMGKALGYPTRSHNKRPVQVPDAVLHSGKPGDRWLVVEVGQFNPSKWPDSIPVLHIGFNRNVSLVNPTGSEFEIQMVEAIRTHLSG